MDFSRSTALQQIALLDRYSFQIVIKTRQSEEWATGLIRPLLFHTASQQTTASKKLLRRLMDMRKAMTV